MSVSLKAYGYGNFVVYTGKAQPVEDALASILPYLNRDKLVYYWNNIDGWYESVAGFSGGAWHFYGTMVPYGVYYIEVTQDCTWTYGVDETAPTWVQLYSGWNYVAYCGPSQSVEAAFSSILNYLMLYYYYDPYQGWLTPSTMVPNTMYAVKVSQNCEWIFEVEVPEIVPCEISIDAPDSAEEGELVYVAATIRNVSAYNYSYKTEIYAGATLIYSTDDIITSGSSKTYNTSFIMPGSDITILVWVERWSFDHWEYDNAESKVVSLAVAPPPPEFAGKISRKELEYDSVRSSIPVY